MGTCNVLEHAAPRDAVGAPRRACTSLCRPCSRVARSPRPRPPPPHPRAPSPSPSAQTAARLTTLNPEGTVFAEFTALANEHKAINLGQVRSPSPFPAPSSPSFLAAHREISSMSGAWIPQGFPNIDAPAFIRDAAVGAINGPALLNQYTRSAGHPRLVQGNGRAQDEEAAQGLTFEGRRSLNPRFVERGMVSSGGGVRAGLRPRAEPNDGGAHDRGRDRRSASPSSAQASTHTHAARLTAVPCTTCAN